MPPKLLKMFKERHFLFTTLATLLPSKCHVRYKLLI
jgi:hypothetical protein